jgi:hypothetical protein
VDSRLQSTLSVARQYVSFSSLSWKVLGYYHQIECGHFIFQLTIRNHHHIRQYITYEGERASLSNYTAYKYCRVVWSVTLDGVLHWILDVLTTYTHNSEVQVITAPSLISTIHKSPHHPLSLFQPDVFTSSCLVTASNNGYSSVSALKSSLKSKLHCD